MLIKLVSFSCLNRTYNYEFKQPLDSYYETFYLERNEKLTTESELETFFNLHPHERGKLKLEKVFVCGLCTFSLASKK